MAAADVSSETLIADRYRVVRELGRGGMAVAYEVQDIAKGETLALKRLLERPDKLRSEVSLLFEREYHSLVQLAHPCVVEVKDFDRDRAGQPFYTMELLQGQELRNLAPVPWRAVCALLSDICSALSLLHSRRLLHRDLTPRNVQCIADGRAKLLDFGAVVPFGVCRQIVGTPSYCAPELIARQPLDGRTDLFSLGATAYFALTGRPAYQSRDFAGLRNAWRSTPRSPSQVRQDVPPALGDLVMSMLQLDRAARPGSAAEVMERACAIGGLDMSEKRVVQQAYLSAPVLVERDEPIARVRKLMLRTMRGRGGRLLVTGKSGVGRSRFVSSCALEGKLLGAVVLTVDASDARGGAFSAARELAGQLFEALPAVVGELSSAQRELFDELWPQLLVESPVAQDSGQAPQSRFPGTPSAPPPASTTLSPDRLAALRPRLQLALKALLVGASNMRPMLVTADDLHLLDEPSAALLALLADVAPDHRMAVVASAERAALSMPSGALEMFADGAKVIKLLALSEQGTLALLTSIFGDVPHLQLLSGRLHQVSEGAPGAVMELAQHLLRCGKLRYETGAWWLPSEIGDTDLPVSLQEALEFKLDAVQPEALRVAQGLALSPGLCATLAELSKLWEAEGDRALLGYLDQLVEHEILDVNGDAYGLQHVSLGKLLVARLDEETTRKLHLQLAELLERRDPEGLPLVHQLIQAGEMGRALDVLLAGFGANHKRPIEALMTVARNLTPGWQQRYRDLARFCRNSGRPRAQYIDVLASMIAFAALVDGQLFEDFESLDTVLQQAAHDSGLDIYARLEGVPEGERLGQALQQAQERYDQAPEDQRVSPPADAIPRLARATVQSIGIYGGRNDRAFFARAPSIEPLVPLSRSLWVIQQNLVSTMSMASGRLHHCRPRFEAILEELGEPEDGNGEEHHVTYMRLAIRFAASIIAVGFGRQPPAGYLESLEGDPIFEVNAARLRMILALRHGDMKEADQQRHRAELLRVQNSPPQMFEGTHLGAEYTSYVFYGDLARLKQVLPLIEAKAERAPGWQATWHHAQGEYQLMRGDLVRAAAEFDKSIALAPVGREVTFCAAAAGLVKILRLKGQAERAGQQADAWIVDGESRDFGTYMHSLYSEAAHAHSQGGHHGRASELAGRAVELLEQEGAAGTLVGAAHETAARVAIEAGNLERFTEHTAACAEHYALDSNPTLAARYNALLKLGNLAPASSFGPQDEAEQARSKIELMLTQCRDSRDRAARTLEAIVEELGCEGGFLFLMKERGPQLAAQILGYSAPQQLETEVAQYLEAEIDGETEVTLTAIDVAACEDAAVAGWPSPDGGHYYPSLLAHPGPDGHQITGLVALRHRNPRRARLRPPVSEAISRALSDAGDVVTAMPAF